MDLETIVLNYKKEKNEKDFNKIYKETFKLVKSILYTYTCDSDTIDDLTQEVYLKIVNNIDKY